VAKQHRLASLLAPGIGWIIVLVCSGLPLAWIAWQMCANPHTLAEMKLDAFRLHLLIRTIGFNALAGVIAVLLALPAAIVLGRGRGIFAGVLWFILPISLLMPSLAMTYGWKQFVRLTIEKIASPTMLGYLEPAGALDVLRCIWSLGAWLYPIPAVLVGLALRQLDPSVQEQALLDGTLWRTTFRQLLSPIIASFCIVTVLAVQEFAIYEPTGISVIATEVRMVFDTGGFSSMENPITQTMGQGVGGGGAGESSVVSRPSSVAIHAGQGARASASVAASAPLLGVVVILAIVAMISSRKLSINESIQTGTWPRALNAPAAACVIAILVSTIALGIPILSMVLSLQMKTTFQDLWIVYQPQITGSILIAGATGIVALILALLSASSSSRIPAFLSLLTFLVGGQLLAIAMIRIYNHRILSPIYNALPMIVIAHLARFGWIALFAGRSTFSPAWKQLRDLSQVDGATKMQISLRIVLPIAWPLLLAAGMVILALSLTEVPATVLISPQRPQPIIPMLMTWVHMQRFDPMIQASLLLCASVGVIGILVVIFARIGIAWSLKRPSRLLPLFILSFLILGCDDSKLPDAIWLETGNGPGQVVYPRAITYDKNTDTFFICDRLARIQHLDHDGKFLNEWQMPQWKLGKPVGLSVGPDGNLWVPDTHYHRVVVYTPLGEKLREFGSFGTAPGQFVYPTDIAFDAKGKIYVSEYGDNDRISVFSPDANFLYSIGKFGTGDGEFSRPQSMVLLDDLIYVTDACNHRICVFKTDGTWVRNMGSPGSAPGQFRFPYGMDLDRDGNLVVVEFGNNRVQTIDRATGKGLRTWGTAGRDAGQLAYPWAIAVDTRGREVIVDAGNNRLQVLAGN
jgi:ABC-type Fe3+ transport system permease subunit/DNA-binding beta-propeller fold protein YncE